MASPNNVFDSIRRLTGIAGRAPKDSAETKIGDPDAPRDHYVIDLTISPQPSATPFQFWEPSELTLVPAGARVGLDIEDVGVTENVEVYRAGAFGPNEGCKYHGAQRLRWHVSVPGGTSGRFRIRYYFETFGEIVLP